MNRINYCEISNKFRVFKDIEDAGYKLNLERLIKKQFNLKHNTLLIPLYNMMMVYQRIIQYNNKRPMLLDSLRGINTLEEMTEKEKIKYATKPTS